MNAIERGSNLPENLRSRDSCHYCLGPGPVLPSSKSPESIVIDCAPLYSRHSVRGRDPVPSSPQVPKLAENYDSDDGYNRTPPLLPMTVKDLKPTPSPEPQQTKSPTPDRVSTSNHKGPKRRQKTQASQGDAVLIGFLGGLNTPDIASRAGEEPLNSASQSEAGDPSEGMEVEVASAAGEKSFSLVQAAQDALPLVDESEGPPEDHSGNPRADETRRSLSKLHTQDLVPSSQGKAASDAAGPNVGKEGSDGQITSNPKANTVAYSSGNAEALSPRPSSPPPSRPAQVPPRLRSQSSATSPLRRFAIPASEGSPMETLPAMHTSPSSHSAKSPKSQQTLPPLHAHFANLVEGHSPSDSNIRPNGLNPARHTFPLMNGSVHSPPLGSITSRPGQFPSPQTRLNNRFPSSYPSSQPSSASTYSDASPREPYRQGQDTTNMSPPGRFVQNQYYPDGRTPQSDDLTPLSAESYPSAGNFSADTSPNGDHPNLEGRPILPPLSSVPLLTGLFKCENAGCTAAPFQTQYLLK